MPGSKWFMSGIEQNLTATGYIIVIHSDTSCHLWMRWTVIPPQEHLIQRTKRGLAFLVDKYFCFDAYHDNEQEEAGDTLEHTFIKEPWPSCETRYFYFHGEIAGVASKSTTAILSKHRVQPPPTPITAYFYPDAHPEVSSVDGFAQRAQSESSWASLVIGPGIAAYDKDYNIQIGMHSWTLQTWYFLNRALIVFDTTSIPVGSTIQSASLDLFCSRKFDDLSATPGLVLTPANPASNTALMSSDYQAVSNTPLLSPVLAYGDIQLNAWNTFTFNSAGLAYIVPNQHTKLAVRFHPYDVLGTTPPWSHYTRTEIQFHESDAHPTSRPQLTVTYLP